MIGRRTTARFRPLVPATTLLLILAGCGDSPEKSPEVATPAARPAAGAPGPTGNRSPGAAPIAGLAANVRLYEAKARLIRLGAPALPFLLAQASGPDEELAVESSGTIRWIVVKWKDHPEAAAAIADELVEFTRGSAPAERRAFAVDLLGDLGGEVAVHRLAELLEDDHLGSTAALALGRIPGPAARGALTGALGAATGERRAELYSILGGRAEPESIPLLLEAAAEDDAAVAALGGYDDPEVLSWLLDAVRQDRDAALDALLASPAAAHDGRLLAQAATAASGDNRQRVAARVRSPEQYDPALVEALLDMPIRGAVGRARAEALLSLAGRMDAESSASVALEALDGQWDATLVVEALRVCAQVCPQQAADEIGEALDSSDPKIRFAAIDALSRLPGELASIELREAIGDAEPAAVPPLVRALSERRDGAAVEALLTLTSPPAEGLEGELLDASLAMAPALRDHRHAASIWARSLDLQVTLEAIDGLGRVGGAAQVPRLETVLETSAGELFDATRRALVGVGRRLASAGQTDPAVAALESAFRGGAPVEGDLRRLGQRIDLVAHGGRVDAWWSLSGAVGSGRCREVGPPRTELAALNAEGDPAPWGPIEAADSRGLVELGTASSGEAPLWLVADLVPRSEASIGVLVRSSADVALWLNGHALEPEPREEAGDGGDRYATRLVEGANQLLVRLCDTGPQDLLVVQLEDERGRPLKFRIR